MKVLVRPGRETRFRAPNLDATGAQRKKVDFAVGGTNRMDEDDDQSIIATATRRVGTMVRGKFRLDRLLGVGGMATVYAATHRNGRRYALKILHVDMRGDARRHFLREARLANRVDHPGAIHVIDEDVGDDGHPFLVLPLLQGETLRARWESRERRLSLNEVLFFAWLVLDVLAVAHAKSVVHRDIKPENIFFTTAGELRVLDFGIARVYSGSGAAVSRTGAMTGTPTFMAPEQVLGHTDEIDGQTDIWAVGATMFSLLSGQYVHEGKTENEVLVSAGSKPARRLAEVAPEVPAEACAIVDRALAFERSERWADAEAMQTAIDECSLLCFDVAARSLAASLPRATAGSFVSQGSHSSGFPPLDETEQPGASSNRGRHDSLIKGGMGAFRLAVTRTLQLDLLGTPRRRARFGLSITGVLLLAGIGVARARFSGEPSRSRLQESVLAHLEMSQRAWRDGSSARSRADASQATKLDTSSAAAHLALLRVSSYWPDDAARSEFLAAQQAREQLSALDRDYLDATAPAMTVPADFRLSAQRLRTLHERAPESLEVSVALADMSTRVGAVDAARQLLEPLAAPADAPGVVLATLGVVYGLQDDVSGARRILERCLASYPAANRCAGMLSQLELNEGRCPGGRTRYPKRTRSRPEIRRGCLPARSCA